MHIHVGEVMNREQFIMRWSESAFSWQQAWAIIRSACINKKCEGLKVMQGDFNGIRHYEKDCNCSEITKRELEELEDAEGF